VSYILGCKILDNTYYKKCSIYVNRCFCTASEAMSVLYSMNKLQLQPLPIYCTTVYQYYLLSPLLLNVIVILVTHKKCSRLDVRKFVSSNRVIDSYNALSNVCVNCTTVNQFKNYIKCELQPET